MPAVSSNRADAIESQTIPATQDVFGWTLSIWLAGGDGVAAMRALSAIATVLALIPIYFGVRTLRDAPTALMTTLLVATNPLVLMWGQVARPYALQSLLIAVTFWAFARIWISPASTARLFPGDLWRAFRRHGSANIADSVAWFGYIAFGAMAMIAQYPAGFFLLGCNCAVALRILGDWRRNQILLLNWILAHLLLIALLLLRLPTMLTQFTEHLSPGIIASKHSNYLIDGSKLVDFLLNLVSVANLWRLRSWFAVLFVILAVMGVLRLARSRQALPLSLLAFIRPVVKITHRRESIEWNVTWPIGDTHTGGNPASILVNPATIDILV